jgi:hypothetical protein
VREYSEEFLGQPEHDGSSGRSLDYEHWPFFRTMQRVREQCELRVYVLGVALHALGLNATIVTVAVIDSIVFDFLFREAAHVNTEGEVVVRWEATRTWPFIRRSHRQLLPPHGTAGVIHRNHWTKSRLAAQG